MCRNIIPSFCFVIFSHFTLELSQETYEILGNYIRSSEHPLLQHLFNTTLEVIIVKTKIENNIPQISPKQNASVIMLSRTVSLEIADYILFVKIGRLP